MTHEFSPSLPVTELRAAYVEDAMHVDGTLYNIAQEVIGDDVELQSSAVGNIIMPLRNPDTPKQARVALEAQTKEVVTYSATLASESILALATTIDMRYEESLSNSTLARIDPERAVWLIEGGANKTSVVRRSLALDAMAKMYGDDAKNRVVYQSGTDRIIAAVRPDGKPNPEYTVAQEIAADFMPAGYLTEFGLNVASARQTGFSVFEVAKDGIQQLVGHKEGSPTIIFIQPPNARGGLSDAFSALQQVEQLEGRQLVIATNGQYRAKDELQAERWAWDTDIETLPAVAIGDELGYEVMHDGKKIVTGPRTAVAYVNEMVILDRLSRRPKA